MEVFGTHPACRVFLSTTLLSVSLTATSLSLGVAVTMLIATQPKKSTAENFIVCCPPGFHSLIYVVTSG